MSNCNINFYDERLKLTAEYGYLCTGRLDTLLGSTRYAVLYADRDRLQDWGATSDFYNWLTDKSIWRRYFVKDAKILRRLAMKGENVGGMEPHVLDLHRIPSWVHFVSVCMAYRTPWDGGSLRLFNCLRSLGESHWSAFKLCHAAANLTPVFLGQRAWAGTLVDAFDDDEPETLTYTRIPREWWVHHRRESVDATIGLDCLSLTNNMSRFKEMLDRYGTEHISAQTMCDHFGHDHVWSGAMLIAGVNYPQHAALEYHARRDVFRTIDRVRCSVTLAEEDKETIAANLKKFKSLAEALEKESK